jgi:hypothetical protein
MKTSSHFAQSEGPVSELAALSYDPALAFRSNPAFRAKFRNPDEIDRNLIIDAMRAGARGLFDRARPRPFAAAFR